jgi:hypothetical protein
LVWRHGFEACASYAYDCYFFGHVAFFSSFLMLKEFTMLALFYYKTFERMALLPVCVCAKG